MINPVELNLRSLECNIPIPPELVADAAEVCVVPVKLPTPGGGHVTVMVDVLRATGEDDE